MYVCVFLYVRTIPTDGRVFIGDRIVRRMISPIFHGSDTDNDCVRLNVQDIVVIMSFYHVNAMSFHKQRSAFPAGC